LPELPLDKTLSRKSVLYQVGRLISGNDTHLDLSTLSSGALLDKLAQPPVSKSPFYAKRSFTSGFGSGPAGDVPA
jgi:hypothetical protein